jgi:hypothetical protein
LAKTTISITMMTTALPTKPHNAVSSFCDMPLGVVAVDVVAGAGRVEAAVTRFNSEMNVADGIFSPVATCTLRVAAA